MTLERYWTILIKQWKLVVICVLLVGVGAFIGSKLMKPLYESSALVQVVIRSSSNNQADYNNLMASDQLVQTEATLAISYPVLHEVASHYSGLTASQLAEEVSSSPKTSTQIFEIDVVDPSPIRAASIANDVASTLIQQQLQAMQQENAQAQQQIQQKLTQIQQQIDDTTAKISVLSTKGGDKGQLAALQSQLSVLQQKYDQWQTALNQLELTQVQGSTLLSVVQPAQPATSPVKPSVLLNTGGGLLAGLLLGMLLALLFERLDTRVRTPEELVQLLRWPVLATIWRTTSLNPNEVINPAGHNVNVERFRILRTNIGFSSLNKPLHSMIVTSALPRDGKSVIAANLATFMAISGKFTLLIDADLRSPIQHTLFGLTSDKLGFTHAVQSFHMQGMPNNPSTPQFLSPASTVQVSGGATTDAQSLVPFVHAVGIPNLRVMPSGPLPANPSELLESKAMQRFLAVIAQSGIEVVIFDTSPLLGLSDASILASKVDGVLVVVDTTRATKEKLKQAKVILEQTGVHVLGCVANKLQHKHDDSTYNYYTEDQNSGGKSTRNGHMPPVPVPPMLAEPHFEQRFSSN